MNKVENKRKFLRSLSTILALSTALSGCGFEGKEVDTRQERNESIEEVENIENDKFEESAKESDYLFDSLYSKLGEDSKPEAYESLYERLDNYPVDEEELVIPHLSIAVYDGESLKDALRLEGYEYSYDYCAKLAGYFHIENYKGTPAQNLKLLNYLRGLDNNFDFIYQTKEEILEESSQELQNENTALKEDNQEHHSHKNKNSGNKKPADKVEKEEQCNHIFIWKALNDEEEIGTCRCGEKEIRKHSFDDGKYIGNGKDEHVCKTCGHKVNRDHEHTVPDNIDFVFSKSNEDGTHELKAEAKCSRCNEVVPFIKTEKCDLKNSIEKSDDADKHYEVSKCSVCSYKKKQEVDCYSDGKKYYKKVDGKVYEYELCSACGKKINYTLHKNHQLSDWKYVGDGTDKRVCLHCDYSEERNHVHEKVPATVSYVFDKSNEDGTHRVRGHYDCSICKEEVPVEKDEKCDYKVSYELLDEDGKHNKVEKCSVCGHQKEQQEECIPDGNVLYETVDGKVYEYETCKICAGKVNYVLHTNHELGDWEYDGNGKDKRVCLHCSYTEERSHIHEEVPKDLTYVLKGSSSENDGTHELVGKYTCTLCGEELEDIKKESCDIAGQVPTYEKIVGGNFTVKNEHYEVYNCSVCGPTKVLASCTPTGDMKYMKFNAQIYEFYNCSDCGNRCEQYPHYHGPLVSYVESNNGREHIGYCECGYDGVYDDHHYIRVPNGSELELTCQECGKKKTVANHDHLVDEMDYMDIVLSPLKSHLTVKSPIANPYPSWDAYCVRYDAYCPTCDVNYSIYYKHQIKDDGLCSRGKCYFSKEDNVSSLSMDYNCNENIEELEEFVLPELEELDASLLMDEDESLEEVKIDEEESLDVEIDDTNVLEEKTEEEALQNQDDEEIVLEELEIDELEQEESTSIEQEESANEEDRENTQLEELEVEKEYEEGSLQEDEDKMNVQVEDLEAYKNFVQELENYSNEEIVEEEEKKLTLVPSIEKDDM